MQHPSALPANFIDIETTPRKIASLQCRAASKCRRQSIISSSRHLAKIYTPYLMKSASIRETLTASIINASLLMGAQHVRLREIEA